MEAELNQVTDNRLYDGDVITLECVDDLEACKLALSALAKDHHLIELNSEEWKIE